MYFYILFGELDDVLVTVMAYNHFVVICTFCIHGHHEPLSLWTAGSDILGSGCLVFLATQLNGVAIVLLSSFANSPLFL